MEVTTDILLQMLTMKKNVATYVMQSKNVKSQDLMWKVTKNGVNAHCGKMLRANVTDQKLRIQNIRDFVVTKVILAKTRVRKLF